MAIVGGGGVEEEARLRDVGGSPTASKFITGGPDRLVICMRIVISEGRVNIYNLAKNAGTSVEQIERFYAKHLPLSPEMARNLQSYGGKPKNDR